VIWPEEATVENEGAYPALAYNAGAGADDIYVAWERNWGSNTFNGNPFVYIQAAAIAAGSSTVIGSPSNPIVVTQGQPNGDKFGGVKSLDLEIIPGYNRGTSNDFPRIAWNAVSSQVIVEWNDASHHPLGDIYLRAFGPLLTAPGGIRKVNDDNSFALHMFPAVCVLSNGSIVSSWYDRRTFGPTSALTEYWGEVRSAENVNGTDFTITTGATDWTNTGSIIIPNFGDYTDNTCVGSTAYFNWSDGRVGVPQPFVDHHTSP
jgi:hypothetical protein